MNKYAVLVLALSCLTSGFASPIELGDELESSAAFVTSDEEETANLNDRTRIFSDFCLTTRGMVIGDIRSRSNEYSSTIFNVIFNTAGEIGNEALALTRQTTDEVAEQIRNPDADTGSYNADNEVERNIHDIRESVKSSHDVPATFVNGFLGAVKLTATTIANRVSNKFNQFRNNLGLGLLTEFLQQSCDRVAEYEAMMEAEFDRVKSELVSSDPSIANLRLRDVACSTSRKIIRLDGVCNVAKRAKDPFMKAALF